MAPALRFDRSARYGASIVAMLFGAYLGVVVNFSAIVQAENYSGSVHTDVPLLNTVQYLVVLGTVVAALALLPTPVAGRIGGITLAAVVLLLWATLGLERGAGNIGEPVAFWSFVLNQAFVVMIACVGGWVIARGRHPLTWCVVVVAVAPSIVSPIMDDDDFTTGAYALVTQGIVVVGGLGAVWLAAWLDRLIARRRGPDASPS